MKERIRRLCAATATTLALCGCSTTRHHPLSWEYKVISLGAYAVEIEQQIQEHAADGWCVFSVSSTYSGDNTIPTAIVLFQRPGSR